MAGQWLRNVGQWARQWARQWPAAPLAARWVAARPAVASVGPQDTDHVMVPPARKVEERDDTVFPSQR